MHESKIYQMKWDLRFLGLAAHIAQWSKDPSTKVGAVICDNKNRIISQGFNGFPRGVHDLEERLQDRDVKLQLVIHAELNAILFSNKNLENCTLYVSPLPPCVRCAAHIIQAGIKRVVCPQCTNPRWMDSAAMAKDILKEARVHVVEIPHGGLVGDELGMALGLDMLRIKGCESVFPKDVEIK